MFEEFRDEAQTLLEAFLKRHKIKVKPVFSIPQLERFGDLSSNMGFQLSPIIKKSPAEAARIVLAEIKPSGLIREVKSEGGYINFYIDYQRFTKALLKKIGTDFGKGYKTGKVIVEHTSANPDGPLHIGHLRNAVIGDTLVKILRFAGYETEAHYYVNDMGKQAAKVVWGLRRFKLNKDGKRDQAIGEVYIEANKLIEDRELDNEISEILTRYEQREQKTVDEFVRAVEYCLFGIKQTLSRLDISHDRFVWENTFVKDGSVEKAIRSLENTGYAKREDGALMLDLKEFGIEKEMVLKRSDGTSLYIARDLAHHAWKMKRGIGLNVWGADHKLVSDQLKAGLIIMGLNPPEFIIHEFISLPEGSMSTRKGVFISADQLLDETVKKAYEEVRKRRPEIPEDSAKRIAEDVGVSAVRFNIERIAPEKSMVFKWTEALDFERQGAPFIQYAYARGKKILLKAKEPKEVSLDYDLADEEKKLINIISRFPDAVNDSALSRKVSIIAGYVVDLSNAFQGFYMSCRVLGSKEEKFRLALVKASVTVLGNSMDLLGIKRLDEM